MDGVTATGMVGGDDEAGMDDGDANSDGGDAQGISVAPEGMAWVRCVCVCVSLCVCLFV